MSPFFTEWSLWFLNFFFATSNMYSYSESRKWRVLSILVLLIFITASLNWFLGTEFHELLQCLVFHWSEFDETRCLNNRSHSVGTSCSKNFSIRFQKTCAFLYWIPVKTNFKASVTMTVYFVKYFFCCLWSWFYDLNIIYFRS